MVPTAIVKRDGSVVSFDRNRIAAAIDRAQRAVDREDPALADELARVVVDQLDRTSDVETADIEVVQDAVVYVLQESGNYDTALAYTRYRDQRERARRHRRLEGEQRHRPNLQVLARDGRSRPWESELLERHLRASYNLSDKMAAEVRHQVEAMLATSEATQIHSHLLLSLVDSALVARGQSALAEKHAPLRIDRDLVSEAIEAGGDEDAVVASGRAVLRNWSLVDMPAEVRRLYMRGRLWIDGLDDPLRGSHFSAALDGSPDPWQVVATAFAMATETRRDWRRVTLIIPPIILGHLEREEGRSLVPALERLAGVADCFLYCDGRTPLLDEWPFTNTRISIATYAQDFLILRQLQALGLEHLSGPGLMQGGYRRRVAVSLALNAQGLDEHFSQLDHLAMGLVAAARSRLRQLNRPALAGASVRYALYGLPPGSSSTEYLERQVVQEGLRCGIALSRTSSLPEEACAHLGRLFEAEGR